ncbi:biotin-dependent carboxyltransferase family protein [Xinfangfangia sp. CPCC 101601]|uniref:Biotin-dependent carboxyltransferase family protein n=1 Tax=Pseudogemmobacter lacusdianii TaxID=3069608 RepID=A0ABU0VXR8_9RHOB|nr:biotin-dependent carboxyltransferase family protein [Xinfangfangia sp. CPCC 101601]MDQ2066552.1 biotin-dependent carboxyltransferase family protein [Xinfangfangia sp. CPCC 101601]
MVSNKAEIEVLEAGPHVTLQDAGRPGLMRFGVPNSGPMDRKALTIANTALGNPAGQSGIEVSPAGLRLRLTRGTLTLAIAGGGFAVSRNGQALRAWQVVTLQQGDELTLRPGPWGSWCCLAVAGQLEADTWLGATATHGLSGLGGGALRAGQSLTVNECRTLPERPIPCPVFCRPRRRLNVILGPQDALFSDGTVARFLSQTFRLTAAFDRMGQRLAGPNIAPEAALGIPSQGLTRGAVQVSGDGIASILMADHQTTGGYPKIATVLLDDTDGLAQLRPGDAISFTAITPAKAVQLARQRARAFQCYLAQLASH